MIQHQLGHDVCTIPYMYSKQINHREQCLLEIEMEVSASTDSGQNHSQLFNYLVDAINSIYTEWQIRQVLHKNAYDCESNRGPRHWNKVNQNSGDDILATK